MNDRLHVSASKWSWRGVARLWSFDLKRFRVPVGVVLGFELLRAVLGEWAIHQGTSESGGPFSSNLAAFEVQTLDGALWIATAVTTAILIQADHPADDRGFLRSRPVGPWTLAVAKLTLLAALFVVLPFVVTAVRLAAYGAPAKSIAASAVQFAVIGGAVALPAWTLALATRTLPRFLASAAGLVILWYGSLAAIVSFGAASLVGMHLFMRVNNGPYTTFAPPLADWQYVDSRGWLFALAMTMLAAGVVVSYYRSRRAVASAAAGLVLIALPAALPALNGRVAASADIAAQLEGRLRLDALFVPHATAVERRARAVDEPYPRIFVMGALRLPPLPVNLSAERKLGEVELSWASGHIRTEGLPLYGGFDQQANSATVGAVRPVRRVEPADEMLFTLPRHEGEALRDRRVDVRARVDLQLTRHEFVAELPVRNGAAFRTRDYLFEVVSVDRRDRIARYRLTRFPSLSSPGPRLTAYLAHRPDQIGPAQFAFDQSRYEGSLSIGWAFGRTWTRAATLPVSEWVRRFEPTDHPPNGSTPPGDQVTPIAPRLRIVESRPIGELRTTIVARAVPVQTLPPPPPRMEIAPIGPPSGQQSPR
jgi:hypothetical protein